ncbi:TonB family protein [Caulobacter endophyticus]|uniref:Transcriptional regulator n=1 Tax=Caulobacter endophyticus TaxID=2172652 RepID=A0A2T9JKX7_9CAUL|nr:TonB family protein [Caulobacter endophyticus]PVM84328.1 transcriptional regulator [Caulobacter endophyticus]
MSGPILEALIRANLALALAIVAVMLLRRPVRRRFGPLAAYVLWLAAPLCALVSLVPVHAPTTVMAPAVEFAATAARTVAPAAAKAPALATIVFILWEIGVALAFALFAIRQARFVRAVGRLTPLDDNRAVLRGEHVDAGPLVLGWLRPRIVVPADFADRFEGEARALVLAHEDVHLRRGDATINGLVVALQCLCWFNPLVHLAAKALRVDQEIACDAAVIERHPHARRLYAETLLSTVLTVNTAPLGCHWPAAGPPPLKERLTMLNAASLTPLRRKAGLALVVLVASAAAGAVWAANPAPALEPAVITRPDWAQKPTADDLARFYPADAAAAKAGGRATISCTVAVAGNLENCRVLRQSEEPYAFGEAAIQLSQIFRMQPQTLDGKPTAGGKVTIPILFSVPK